VWRELKKLGAVYLRDGVALLPNRPELRDRLNEVRARINEYEGTADIVDTPSFPKEREAELISHFTEDRAAEYRELYHASVRFLRDVLHDVDAEEFGFPDVDNLESELGRLVRWFEQVKERDYFSGAGADRVAEILGKCERAFDHFVHEASQRHSGPEEPQHDDAFQRLAGGAERPGEDYPI
jgi:hypothetical protein